MAEDGLPELNAKALTAAGSPLLYRVPPSPHLPTAYRFSISSPAPSAVKDEPKIISSSIASSCPTCADGEHRALTKWPVQIDDMV